MHTRSFRRIARLFASVLLVWTAADVCDYGLCPHHREPLGGFAQTAVREGAAQTHAPTDVGDDCFCCSHVVDVRTPFRVTLGYALAWRVSDDHAGEPHVTSNPLYHPPLV